MKKEKIIAMLSLAILMTALIAGCRSADKSSNLSKQNASIQAQSDVSGKTGSLKWYVVAATGPQADSDRVQKAMSDYINETYGWNIELELVFNDYASHTDKMQMVIAGGEEYDLCYTSSWCNNYTVNVNKNAYIHLDDLLEEYGQELYNSIPEGVWEGVKIGGQIYGVPNYQLMYKQCSVAIPVKYVEEFQLDVDSVKTIYDLEDFMYAVKKKYPEIYPLAAYPMFANRMKNGLGMEEIIDYDYPGMFKMFDESLTVYNQYESEEYMKFYEYMYKWAQDGLIKMDAISVQDQSLADLQAGIHVIGLEDTYQPEIEKSRWNNYFGGQECVMIKLSEPYMSTAATIATLTSISTTCKNPELAMQFLNLINTDPVLYNMACFGIEGVHYTLNDNGTVTSDEASGYNPNSDWVFGNQFNAFPRDSQSPDIWVKIKEYNDTAKVSCAMGFSFDSSVVDSELSAISAVTGEYLPQLSVGAVDPKTAVPEMMKKLEAAGMDAVLEEMQKQVDEWKAEK